jgi:tetratricopeptide (TPR) repeat protein
MQLHLAIVLSDKSLSPIAKKEKDKKEKGKEEKDKEKHTISVSVTAAEAARLDAAMRDDMEAPMKVLDTRVDGWRKGVEAPTEAQRASIDKAIEKAGPNGESGGYEDFGRKLADILHTWLLDRAKVMLDALPRDERDKSTLVDRTAKLLQDFGDLEAAEPLCREQVESRTKALGEHHSDTLEAVNNLALLLHQLGKLDEALPFSQRKLAGCRAILGDRHPDTITAIDTTSQLLSDLGRLGDALPLKRESLAEKRRTLGERHPDTLLSVNNLAVLLNDLGRQMGDLRMLREAEPLKREALAGCREVLGNRHPHTLASVANLADLLMQLAPGDPRALKEAEPLARESLAGTREVLGNGHPETLKSVGMMAALLVEQGHQCPPKSPQRDAKFREAEPLYREAVVGFSKGLGQYHPTPLSYAHEHDRLLLDMGMVKEAESAARELLSGCRAQLGDSHPETLISITHLGAVLRHAGRLNEALPLPPCYMDSAATFLRWVLLSSPQLPADLAAEMDRLGLTSLRFDKIGQVRNGKNFNFYDDRNDANISQMWSATAGFDHMFANNWSLRGNYQYGESKLTSEGENMIRVDHWYLSLDAVRDPATGAI